MNEVTERMGRMMQEALAKQRAEMQQQIDRLVSDRLRAEGTALSAVFSAADTQPVPGSTRKTVPDRQPTAVRSLAEAFATPLQARATSAAPTMDEPLDEESRRRRDIEQAVAAAMSRLQVPIAGGYVPADPLNRIMTTMKNSHVPAFYGDSTVDKSSVMDWVEKVESVMRDSMSDKPHLRLTVVRMLLDGAALSWMNARMAKLARQHDELYQPEWERDMRREFIIAHVGSDTPDRWLTKMGALRLGEGDCTTPDLLNAQFDKHARHVHPTMHADDPTVDLMLRNLYRDIIMKSSTHATARGMFRRVMTSQAATDKLEDWKARVANDWDQQAVMKGMYDNARMVAKESSGGGYRFAAKAAGMDAEETSGSGGEQVEGRPAQQLNAFSSGGQRGGRGGGRGGRGVQGPRPEWSAEKKQLYADRRCFHCKQPGHTVADCKVRQSNVQAGQ